MRNSLERSFFLLVLLDETRRRLEAGGVIKIIPIWILLILAISFLLSTKVPDSFWSDSSKSFPFFAGMLAFNGLLLALAWGAFAKIFENICTPKFVSYLKRNDMISVYTFHVAYVHATQIIAVIASGIGLILLICEGIPIWLHRIELVLTIASSVYAIKEAVGAATTMYDLIWYRSIFESDHEQQNSADNVAKLADGTRSRS